MSNKLLICLTCLVLAGNASAQQAANYNPAEAIQRDLTFLLLEKNIDEVTKQLDSETSPTVASLMRRLVIYSRAGHASRVRATLEQLAAAPNWQCPGSYDLVSLIRNLSDGSLAT